MKRSISFLILISLFASCAIQVEKRRYNKGFYVQFGKKRIIKKDALVQKRRYENKIHNSVITGITSSPQELKNKDLNYVVSSLPDNKRSQTIFQLESSSQKRIIFRKSKFNRAYFKEGVLKRPFLDNNLYAIGAVAGLLSFGLIRANREKVLKLTRFSNKNTKRTRWLIAGIQTAICCLGLIAGKGLDLLGYDVSDTMEHALTGVMAGGFITSYVAGRKENKGFLPFYLKKLGFILMGTAFLLSSVGVGNRIRTEKKQTTLVGHYVKFVDDTLFTPDKAKNEGDEVRNDVMLGLMIFACFILGIIGIAAAAVCACSTVCTIMFLGGNETEAAGTFALIALASGFILSLCLFGILKMVKKMKQLKKKNT